MSKYKELVNKINEIVKAAGYDEEATFTLSNRPDLGEFQINDSMRLAKVFHKNPLDIANDIVEKMKADNSFDNINVAGQGFINFSLSDKYLLDFMKSIKNVSDNIDKLDKSLIFFDYGGANVAKALHVGHLRSANIGEGLKRLTELVGKETISDVHLGDSGLQVGMVIYEIRCRYPDLICFSEDYDGSDFDLPIVADDLKDIYPTGSIKAHEDESIMEEARNITFELQKGHLGYNKLWDKVSALSVSDIKNTYKMLNTTFDLYEGERTSFEYIPEIFKIFEDKKLIYVSEGATVMDVKEETDKKEMPPVILRKSDGAYLYATTDLATIYERVTKYHPEEIVYITDLRQELHFEQVFRAAIKSGIAKDTKLSHYGFGTMNGPDGKPFKTREGGVMGLHDLINLIYDECYKRINDDIVEPDKKEDTAMKIALAALKYADLVPFRETDYIFDLNKFTSLDGKTGPYLLYSTIRIRSLLNKAKENNIVFDSIKEVDSKEREIILTLFNLPSVIIKAYNSKSLSDIADYIYKLNSVYNSFYADTKIISLDNKDLRESYLYLSNIVYETNMLLLDLMGIDCPEKM